MSADVLGRWVPDRPEDVAAVFTKADFPWWIAGGYAIELAVGRVLRAHGDLDVLVLRRDQALVRQLLADWDLYVADPPGQGELRPWRPGEVLHPPPHYLFGGPAMGLPASGPGMTSPLLTMIRGMVSPSPEALTDR
ncbi:nucleotidyltransferase domain-containing protein [Streptomyces argenteolus]|uniref:nucleotidyltransferase domain-containing protein n=1 Tax=Streptomyces sp. NPDC025273 TaxID=3155251 RepID=UPI0033C79D08